ncbi:MBL fold metallo-hydrolase [Halobellus marinus]|jgi:glyoxylase-like metal-dependent hydrolase (beta-lactamase superfamily II)|uniref:MBL fold metallo-hydrolase n=1 Tax=Halobellus TaxID=1073986 RepID=UPI0028AA9E73|nr:MBL fold metallo-hydrolase [Halobellus sp. DFY28]
MAIGDLAAVPGTDDVYYVDVGTHGVPRYGTVYLLDAAQPALVDTGTGQNRELVFDTLDEVGIDREAVQHILPTHVHLDHAGGAGYFADACPNATVRTHEIGVPHLVDPDRLVAGTKDAVGDQWEFYADPEPVPEDRIEGLTDGDEIDLGDRTLSVIHTPGHAPHQTVFLDSRDDLLFTGDAAGIYVPERDTIRETSPPPQFDLEGCLADVRTIEDIAPETLCFGHFGPREYDPELLEGYKRTLVEWVEAVRQKRAELGDDEAVIEHFAENSDMIEIWGERKARAEDTLNVRGVLAALDRAGSDD